jgi:quinol monooxygenase YgiN
VYARSTTIESRPSSIDAAVAHVRDDVMPALLAMDGCAGLSMLVNRRSARCIVTSAWVTENALTAAAERLPSTFEAVDGRLEEVEDWEIVVLHRDHTADPGAWVRVTRVHVEPDQSDRLADLYREALLPQIVEFPGFCSASLMLDRPSGHAVSSVTFDSEEAMHRTRTLAAGVREQGAGHVDGEVLEVDELELVIAHLGVPELA